MIYPENELLDDVPFDAYRAAAGINASGLKEILRSPAHYRHNLEQPRQDTPSLRFGRRLHEIILEPYLMALVYVSPKFNLRTKQGRLDLASWRQDLPEGAVVVSDSEMQMLSCIAKSASEHTVLRRLLEGGRTEATLFWRDPIHNVRCKARYDLVTKGTRLIVDLKSTTDARADAFSRDAYKYHYAVSASHYLAGAEHTGVAEPNRFIWVALEKNPPYQLKLYDVSLDFLALGHQYLTSAMDIYAQCVDTNRWPGYTERFETIEPPGYARLPE